MSTTAALRSVLNFTQSKIGNYALAWCDIKIQDIVFFWILERLQKDLS